MSATEAAIPQNPLQLAVNEALAAKSRRDYSLALSRISEVFRAAPLAFRNAQAWAALFNAPAWFASEAEHDDYLSYADSLMSMIESGCASLDRNLASDIADHFLKGAQFRHTVHNDRMLTGFMTRRSSLFGYALANVPQSRNHVFPGPVSNPDRPRLGIIFKHLREDPETTSVLPFFQTAKASGIEVVLFVVEARGHPKVIEHMRSVCDRILSLPANVGQAVETLRRENLDILLFGNDITAKPSLPAYLSFFKVARYMCCCVSTLVTTASPQMDAYLGCDYYAAKGCAGEFTERFITLPDPGFAFTFPGRQTIGADDIVDRKTLGLEADDLLLTSGANHTKLHADLIATWAVIMKQLPQAKLLLYPFPPHFGPAGAELEQRLRSQFAGAGVDPDRLLLSAPLPGRDAVIAMIRHADLGLDSFPYTGVTTIVDAVEAGLPTVSLAGRTLRTAQAGAILHSIGFDELVVEDKESYIRLAVELGKDGARRQALRDRLTAVSAKKPPFFDVDSFGAAAVAVYRKIHAEMASAAV